MCDKQFGLHFCCYVFSLHLFHYFSFSFDFMLQAYVQMANSIPCGVVETVEPSTFTSWWLTPGLRWKRCHLTRCKTCWQLTMVRSVLTPKIFTLEGFTVISLNWRGNLFFAVDAQGNAVAVKPNAAIPEQYLWDINNAQQRGLTFHDDVLQVRGSQVPPGYEPHPFRAGVPESLVDTLRSIVATCIYRY